MPSVRLDGSKIRRCSSVRLVGEIVVISRRPSSTRGRAAGHSVVGSSVGSPGSAIWSIRRKTAAPLRSRRSSSSRRNVGLRVPASLGSTKVSPASGAK